MSIPASQSSGTISASQAAQKLQEEIAQLEAQNQALKQNLPDEGEDIGGVTFDPEMYPAEENRDEMGLAETNNVMRSLNGQVGSRDKERLAPPSAPNMAEYAPLQEISREYEPPAEVKEWVKEVPDPHTITIPQPVKDEYGEILLKATNIAKPKITLPIKETELDQALHHKVVYSIRWLAEWCKRTIKLYPGRVNYKKEA